MRIENIIRIRRDILKISRVKFSIKTGFSEHTLRRIEKKELPISEKIKIELVKSFKKLDVFLEENFENYSIKNKESIDIEKEIDNRIDDFIRLMKRIHKNLFWIKLQDDKLGGIFKEYSIVFGNKKYDNYEQYISEYCIISFKKTRNIRQKRSILRKVKSIDKRFQKLVLEKIKGETSDLKIELIIIDFICPIFCVRNFYDYES